MSTEYIDTSTAEPLELLAVDGAGVPITGLTDLYTRVMRIADGAFWDWADSAFKSSGWTTLDGVLSERDAVRAAGYYYRIWPGDAAGTYRATFSETTATAQGIPELFIELRVGQLAAPGAAMDLVDDALDAAAVASSGAAEIQSGLATAAAVAALPTASENAAAVVDQALAGHTSAGSVGEALAAAAAAAGLPDAPAIASAVWSALRSSAVAGSGSFGEALLRWWDVAFGDLDSDEVGGGRALLYSAVNQALVAIWPLRDGSGNSVRNIPGVPARRGRATFQ